MESYCGGRHCRKDKKEVGFCWGLIITAIITPIYKSADKGMVTNCGAIAILPVVSKVPEKIVAAQLMETFVSNQLLHSQQYSTVELPSD